MTLQLVLSAQITCNSRKISNTTVYIEFIDWAKSQWKHWSNNPTLRSVFLSLFGRRSANFEWPVTIHLKSSSMGPDHALGRKVLICPPGCASRKTQTYYWYCFKHKKRKQHIYLNWDICQLLKSKVCSSPKSVWSVYFSNH